MTMFNKNKRWTVRELRQALDGLPDDATIVINWNSTNLTEANEFQITPSVEILIGYTDKS